MNNKKLLVDDCKKDKELFNSYVRALISSCYFFYFYSSSFLCCSKEKKRDLYCF